MNEGTLSTLTQTIDGPVAAIDRVYAFDRMRDLCRTAPRVVRRARTHLSAQPHPAGDSPAAAEATLMVDGSLIVCAGVTAATMHEAVDLLMQRFHHRLRRLGEARRDQPIGSLPANAA